MLSRQKVSRQTCTRQKCTRRTCTRRTCTRQNVTEPLPAVSPLLDPSLPTFPPWFTQIQPQESPSHVGAVLQQEVDSTSAISSRNFLSRNVNSSTVLSKGSRSPPFLHPDCSFCSFLRVCTMVWLINRNTPSTGSWNHWFLTLLTQYPILEKEFLEDWSYAVSCGSFSLETSTFGPRAV